jgi:hypothetical protein
MEKLELPVPEEIPSGLVFKLGVTFCTHPLEVSKTLIQVCVVLISSARRLTLIVLQI